MALAQRELIHLIRRKEPFKAGNVFAAFKNGLYVVYSYGEHFPLAAYVDNNWVVNTDRYSPSTTRQMWKIGFRHELPCRKTGTNELRELVCTGSPEWQAQKLLARTNKRITERLFA